MEDIFARRVVSAHSASRRAKEYPGFIVNMIELMKRIFLLLAVILSPALLRAQSFSNLQFEYWQRNLFPLCWITAGATVAPDSTVKISGNYSLKAVRLPAEVEKNPSSYGLIFQDLATAYPYSDLRNKKIEVSVQVKSESRDTAMHVFAFIQSMDLINPAGNKIAFGNDAAGSGWIQSTASVVLEEIPAAPRICVGVLMTGSGEIRIDDYRIRVDGQAPAETAPRTAPLTAAEKKWLEKNIVPLTADPTIDKKRLGKQFRNARIVGIGENVHGSSTVFRLKYRMAEMLIGHDGFTVLAIEDSPSVGEALNRFVRGEDEVLRQNDMNVMYSGRDFGNFMNWLREYNRSSGNKVSIRGVDIGGRYKELIGDIGRMTSGRYAARLDSILSIFNQHMAVYDSRMYWGRAPFSEAQKKYITESVDRMKKEIPVLNLDRERTELLGYYIDQLIHYLTFSKVDREEQMAGNIGRLLAERPGEKIVYLAHNLHVGNEHGLYKELPGERRNEAKSAGAWLKERYQDSYRTIGICYYGGMDLFKRNALSSGQPVIDEAVGGSYEHLFNQLDEACFYLDLSRLRNRTHASGRWLAEPMLLREYGVEPFNYYYEFILKNLTQVFDGVLFVKKSVSI